jgi:lactate dehydrogenase-like 2-hydroxyacid dehydrogenase
MPSPASKPKLLVTRRMPPAVTDRARRDYAATLNPDDKLMSTDELIAAAAGHDALLICSSERMSAPVISRLPASIKAVATFSVGYDHIDVPAANARGLVVTNTPDVLTDSTADIAMLLLLGAARRASEGDAMVRNDQWRGWHTTMMLGKDLRGARLGILGMGRIGRAVAKRARGFGMEIHYHNRSRLAPDAEQGATFHASAEGLLRVSDFLSLHCPSSPEMRGYLNAQRIALLPDGAVVVNTARGDLVDDKALIAALRSGKVMAAGLDVFAGEPKIEPAYREITNAFYLPHLGSATHGTRDGMGFVALDNLDAFFAGRAPPNRL